MIILGCGYVGTAEGEMKNGKCRMWSAECGIRNAGKAVFRSVGTKNLHWSRRG